MQVVACIHDLLHSLCVTLAKESNNFLLTKNNITSDDDIVTRQRRLVFYSGGVSEFLSSFSMPKKLRALLYISENSFTSLNTHFNFKLLLVLSMHIPMSSSWTAVSVPKGIGNLSCLGKTSAEKCHVV